MENGVQAEGEDAILGKARKQTLSPVDRMVSAAAPNPLLTDLLCAPTLNMQAQKAFDSPRRANRGAVADLRDRLSQSWPQGRTALPPKREIILTPLNGNIQGTTEYENEQSSSEPFFRPTNDEFSRRHFSP